MPRRDLSAIKSVGAHQRIVTLNRACKHPTKDHWTDPETGESFCRQCGVQIQTPRPLCVMFEKFGRAPDEAVVMDNNLGCAPGPERKKQVMSALNQDPRTYNGVKFEEAKVQLLNLWAMSGDPTDRLVSVTLKRLIKDIEGKSRIKIPPSRVDGIARLCKQGVKRAEQKKRLAKWEIENILTRIFEKEGLSA